MTASPKVPGSDPLGQFPGSFKYTPIEALRGLFVGFCQGLFNAAPPGCYHWDEDDHTTEIVIQDEAPVKEEVMQKRPLITITRGPLQAYGLGMDDMLGYDADIDRKTKSILVPGTITINCCSRVTLEAENLAWVVFEHIWLLRDLLIKAGLFDTGRNNMLGAPSPAGSLIANDSGDEWVCVPVSVPFQFVRTSSFTPLGRTIIQSIENRLSVNAPGLIRHVGPPEQTGGNVPLSLHVCPVDPLTSASDARGQTPDPGGQKQYFLPKQRHPLDPSKMVVVRTVRPYRPGLRPAGSPPESGVPFIDPCVEESCRTR